MDEYQEQRQNEIGIADVFRILLKRIKLLIAVLLAGAVIGGLFGYFTYQDDKYYGAEVKYEISIIATRNVYAADGTVKKEDGKAPNYVYKDQHISMLIDHLNSDTFATEVLKNMEESAGAVKAVTNADGDIDISSMLASGDKAQAEYAKNYLQWLTKVKNCISFYFDYDTNPNSFYMKVSVRGDAAFAAQLLATAEKIVPLEVSGRGSGRGERNRSETRLDHRSGLHRFEKRQRRGHGNFVHGAVQPDDGKLFASAEPRQRPEKGDSFRNDFRSGRAAYRLRGGGCCG